MVDTGLITALVVTLVIVGVVLLVLYWLLPVRPFVKAWSAGVRISLMDLVAMRLRGTRPKAVLDPLIAATQAGLALSHFDLEAHHLAGGDVQRVVRALIAADRAGIDLDFPHAAAIDLAGRDVIEAVESATRSRDLTTTRLEATAQDGVSLTAVAHMTVRTDLARLVGGAGEDTLVERVGRAVQSAVASAPDGQAVLDDPEPITQAILDQKLDEGTALELLELSIVIDPDRAGSDWWRG